MIYAAFFVIINCVIIKILFPKLQKVLYTKAILLITLILLLNLTIISFVYKYFYIKNIWCSYSATPNIIETNFYKSFQAVLYVQYKKVTVSIGIAVLNWQILFVYKLKTCFIIKLMCTVCVLWGIKYKGLNTLTFCKVK